MRIVKLPSLTKISTIHVSACIYPSIPIIRVLERDSHETKTALVDPGYKFVYGNFVAVKTGEKLLLINYNYTDLV